MKIRNISFWAVVILCAGLTANAADTNTGLAGNWASLGARTAKPDKKSGSVTGQLLKQAGDAAGRQIPTDSSGGRGGRPGSRPGGGLTIDPTATKVIEKGSSPDGIALTMELKLSKTTLSGSVSEVVSGFKAAIEEGKVDGQKFQFTTYKKVNNMGIGTVYKGELVDPKTIKLTRWTTTDSPIDRLPDGSPEVVVFQRGK